MKKQGHSSMAVVCPRCGAGAGSLCKDGTSTINHPHRERMRLAAKKSREG